jgi:hypothetical protein
MLKGMVEVFFFSFFLRFLLVCHTEAQIVDEVLSAGVVEVLYENVVEEDLIENVVEEESFMEDTVEVEGCVADDVIELVDEGLIVDVVIDALIDEKVEEEGLSELVLVRDVCVEDAVLEGFGVVEEYVTDLVVIVRDNV